MRQIDDFYSLIDEFDRDTLLCMRTVVLEKCLEYYIECVVEPEYINPIKTNKWSNIAFCSVQNFNKKILEAVHRKINHYNSELMYMYEDKWERIDLYDNTIDIAKYPMYKQCSIFYYAYLRYNFPTYYTTNNQYRIDEEIVFELLDEIKVWRALCK